MYVTNKPNSVGGGIITTKRIDGIEQALLALLQTINRLSPAAHSHINIKKPLNIC
jgi:hypothetical protein